MSKKKIETLQSWLDCHGMDYPAEIEKNIEHNGVQVPLKSVLGHLWNCADIMPSMYCDQLDLPKGSTYAQAVRSLFKELKK
jgi:hypothetical protein